MQTEAYMTAGMRAWADRHFAVPPTELEVKTPGTGAKPGNRQ